MKTKKFMKAAAVGLGLLMISAAGCTQAPVEKTVTKYQCVDGSFVSSSADCKITEPEITAPEAEIEPVEEITPVIPVVITEEPVIKDLKEMWSEDFYLSDTITLDLNDYHVAKLIDGYAVFDNDDYRFYETLEAEFKVVGSEDNKDFEVEPRAVIEKGKIKINGIFGEMIDSAEIDDEHTADFTFLGKDFKIIKIDAGKVTLQTAGSVHLTPEQSVVSDGKNVKLVRVGSAGSIIIDVNGVTATISEGKTKTVNGVEIQNVQTFYDSNDYKACLAELIVGDDIQETIEDGDAMTIFGEDEDEPEWVWDLEFDGNNLKRMSAVYDIKRTDADGEDDDDALKVGDSITSPNNYIQMIIGKISEPELIKYDFSLEDGYVEVSGNKEFSFRNGDEYKSVYVKGGKIYDDNDEGIELGTEMNLGYSDFKLTATADKIKIGGFEVNYGLTQLVLNGKDISSRDEDVLSNEGSLIIRNPEDITNNQVNLEVYGERREVEIVVNG